MWDLHSWRCSLPTTRQKLPNQIPLLTGPPQNDAVRPSCISISAAAARMLTSWLNRRRLRYLFLFLCSPFLIPLLCATCPIICAVELCFFMSRRRRRAAAGGGNRRRRSGDSGEEVRLLQRYLEDQLMLVGAQPYKCGDEDRSLGEENGVDVECFDSSRTLLQ